MISFQHDYASKMPGDVNMPELNGIEFLKAVKAMPNYKFLPIMLLTTESPDEKRNQGTAAGARAWMVKPFSPSQFVSAAEKLCA